MATMNISVPDPMKDWVQAQIDGGKYASSSDYVRDLIRKDQEDKDKLAKDAIRIVKPAKRDSQASIEFSGHPGLRISSDTVKAMPDHVLEPDKEEQIEDYDELLLERVQDRPHHVDCVKGSSDFGRSPGVHVVRGGDRPHLLERSVGQAIDIDIARCVEGINTFEHAPIELRRQVCARCCQPCVVVAIGEVERDVLDRAVREHDDHGCRH